MAIWGRRLGVLALTSVLAGCLGTGPVERVPFPASRPDTIAPVEDLSAAPPAPSERSAALASYYARLEGSRIAQGLLRTDGGGIDTPFTDTTIVQNFTTIAFYDEYVRGQGLTSGIRQESRLKKWGRPIRFGVEFGTSVPEARRVADRAEVSRYVSRLQRLTGHPMSVVNQDVNFHVLYYSEDDADDLPRRVREIVPNISSGSLSVFRDIPRSIHCLVVAFSQTPRGYDYARAIAFIRAEHPPLMRRSCVHEEIAQGLGLANDSPRARPSIFNDDDEFALLTAHDEILLKILYDPALRAGMSLQEAQPIVRARARLLAGGGS